MARKGYQAEAIAEQTLILQRRHCIVCGQPMWVAYLIRAGLLPCWHKGQAQKNPFGMGIAHSHRTEIGPRNLPQ
ncbi:hypothetical protein KSX_58130 [Ktedonospora formicarum]|uniref:Uncharacterized protein n=1 Tax=Ktedonospora formicarum TaxID=2778364 RepID=A0A8J3MTY6_9CHLR|nr:hypothetical protein KSX_58130 [Ktedonospora formicarum]